MLTSASAPTDRQRRRAGRVALREREDRHDLPPRRRRRRAARVVGRRADRAVQAEAQQHERGDEVEGRHDPQQPVAREAAHRRALGAEHEGAQERARDEVAGEDEERRQREVEAADDLLEGVVVLEAAAGVGVHRDVREEHHRHRDPADRVAAEQVADQPVAERALLRRAVRGRRRRHEPEACQTARAAGPTVGPGGAFGASLRPSAPA
jgi:hypothetical protein